MFWAIITMLVAVLVYAIRAKLGMKKKKLPPGPKGFPLFGALHMLGKFPHHNLQKLARKYGPIMHMRLGITPTIIVSSPKAAEQFLKTHDVVFASRPPHEAGKHLFGAPRDFSFAPYGPYWRDMRKMCMLELLSDAKISTFTSMRSEEVSLFIVSIREAARDRVAFNLSDKITVLAADMTCRMVFGKKYSSKDIHEQGLSAAVGELLHLAGLLNLGDYIPFLARFDLQGLTKKMKKIRKVFDNFFDKIINDRIQFKGEECRTKDFVDVMLSLMKSNENKYHIEKDNIRSIMMDIVIASSDPSARSIEWVISEVIKHPYVLAKVQKELETVVGMNRMVEESDLEKLKYLDMVVKEAFRLHPVVLFLIPHAATEDCVIEGFDISKNSRIIISAWAIGRDPNTWSEPDEFVPERFEGSSVDLRGIDFQLIPFGSGRRGCPGMQLGLTITRFVVAQLLHCFNWELPNGMSPSELDMEEVVGMTLSRKNPLIAVPTYRLME